MLDDLTVFKYSVFFWLVYKIKLYKIKCKLITRELFWFWTLENCTISLLNNSKLVSLTLRVLSNYLHLIGLLCEFEVNGLCLGQFYDVY